MRCYICVDDWKCLQSSDEVIITLDKASTRVIKVIHLFWMQHLYGVWMFGKIGSIEVRD